MTGAQAIAATLACEGTPCLFGVPGAQNNELWDALKARGVPYMLVANESSASVMADAASRATGAVGAFAVVPGPGLTNAMTGIGEALYDSVPIVGIITDIDRSPRAPVGQVHGLANAAIVRPIVKAAIEVRHQAEIPAAVFQAFRIAASGEPGPAVVVIPFPCSRKSGITTIRRRPRTRSRSTKPPTAAPWHTCPTTSGGSGSTPASAASTPVRP